MPEQPWFLHYPEGVPHELSLSPETLLAMFSRSAQRYSRRPALYFFGKTLSYQECHALVERFACELPSAVPFVHKAANRPVSFDLHAVQRAFHCVSGNLRGTVRASWRIFTTFVRIAAEGRGRRPSNAPWAGRHLR